MPFMFLSYAILRILGLALQVLFFELSINIVTDNLAIDTFLISKIILFLTLSVLCIYYSRDISITVQNEIIKHLFLNKFNHSKNNKLNWTRPIVVESIAITPILQSCWRYFNCQAITIRHSVKLSLSFCSFNFSIG